MSAWYIFSSLGFYPVCPGSNEYVIGAPCVDRAVIALAGGKRFVIEAKNRGGANIYIQSVTLNGKPYSRCFIRHEDIARGGTLVFEMGPAPDESRAAGAAAAPYSMSR